MTATARILLLAGAATLLAPAMGDAALPIHGDPWPGTNRVVETRGACQRPDSARTAAAMTIERVLPFATADSVRVQATVAAKASLPGVALTGKIVPFPKGPTLWEGALGRLDAKLGTAATVERTVAGLKPRLWSPARPALYHLTVTATGTGQRVLATKTVRFGFRSFVSKNGRFTLNGRPIFLRGVAINPPGRTIPDAVGDSRRFALDYVRYLKSQNVNTIRLTRDSPVWFDVCDELGMLVYQGVYGAPPGSSRAGSRIGPPTDFDQSVAEYRRLFSEYVRHPSVVIYILSNEMPVSGSRGAGFHAFLSRAHGSLRKWDPTRLFIGNAGYGEGHSGDINDIHRYWGWYYNTFLTYYNLRSDTLFGDPAKRQPLTFTECVGSFTGPFGEYNIVERKQLAPQLGWTGHSPSQREDALGYQAFMVQQATEAFRRLRPLNPRLSGIMPFTILFYNWNGITSFDQMKPKPAMEQMGLSYQPVLLSWELWTPQVYAGSTVRPIAHIVNDADDGSDLAGAVLRYQLRDRSGRAVLSGTVALPRIPYYGTWRKPLVFVLPTNLPTGNYAVAGQIVAKNGSAAVVSRNQAPPLFVAGADWNKNIVKTDLPVALYDPPGKTARALRRLGIAFQPISDLATLPSGAAAALVIGEGAADKRLADSAATLREFVRAGGRILCLAPNPATFDKTWLPEPVSFFTASANDPAYLPKSRPFANNMHVNPERATHPVFAGLGRERFRLWSDYSGWDQTKPGFPAVYPVTRGFALARPDSLARTAILANYDRGLEGVALAEFFDGAGSVLLSGFDIVRRAGLDPAADRLLRNLVVYTATRDGHHVHPLVEKPIRWGRYAAEQGVVTGPLHGLIVNADWVAPPTNPSARPLNQAEGAWNTRPGDPFVPNGRRPFGPFGYTTAAGVRDLNTASKTGSGIFWARIPPGRKTIVTRVRNPAGRNAASLTVEVNGQRTGEPATIAPGETALLRTSLPADTINVSIRYTGDKALVLLETAFE